MNPDLSTRWQQLLAVETTAKQEVDAHHPIRLLFGADDYQRPVFLVMTRTKPAEPELSSDVVETAITVRSDGFYLLHLALKDRGLFDVFAQLCSDLARRSSGADSESAALKAVYAALADWKTLLRSQPEHLSLESLRGLIGELWFGRDVLAQTREVCEVFQGWRGPYGAHQDFQFPDDHLFEVKAVRPGVPWLKIASENQLDTLGKQLVLAVVELADADPKSADALTLPRMLSSLREELVQAPAAAEAFESALRNFGDPFVHSFYKDHAFRVVGHRIHRVSEGFPRLIPSTIPNGISGVEYRLTLDAIAPFRVEH